MWCHFFRPPFGREFIITFTIFHKNLLILCSCFEFEKNPKHFGRTKSGWLILSLVVRPDKESVESSTESEYNMFLSAMGAMMLVLSDLKISHCGTSAEDYSSCPLWISRQNRKTIRLSATMICRNGWNATGLMFHQILFYDLSENESGNHVSKVKNVTPWQNIPIFSPTGGKGAWRHALSLWVGRYPNYVTLIMSRRVFDR